MDCGLQDWCCEPSRRYARHCDIELTFLLPSTNFFTLLALLVFVNGTLIWIFRGFGVHNLDLHQVVAGPLFPLVFFLGVPRKEIFNLSYIVSGRLLVSSDFAYAALAKAMAGPAPFSSRGFGVLTFALANTGSLGEFGGLMYVRWC